MIFCCTVSIAVFYIPVYHVLLRYRLHVIFYKIAVSDCVFYTVFIDTWKTFATDPISLLLLYMYRQKCAHSSRMTRTRTGPASHRTAKHIEVEFNKTAPRPRQPDNLAPLCPRARSAEPNAEERSFEALATCPHLPCFQRAARDPS